MHTAGEPLRIVLRGAPDIPGETILDQRRWAMEHLDVLRRQLMFEPRGHADMYGAFLTKPERPDSDFGVLFMHNEGFSTMCGHAVIALGRAVVESGLTESILRLDTPAGLVLSSYDVGTGQTTFEGIESFVSELDAKVEVPGVGEVKYDLAFGGAFYAYVDAKALDLELIPSETGKLIDLGRRMKKAVMESGEIVHPDHPDLGFLYGVIFVGPERNVCVFADGEIDRSPTGTGVSGRMAIHFERGELALGESMTIASITGETFTASPYRKTDRGVVPLVSGKAYVTGRSSFVIEDADPLKEGFLIR
jgi:trans-L-3-hydroxyproline dehydratase